MNAVRMMKAKPTQMELETRQAPEAVARLLAANAGPCADLAARVAMQPFRLIATCARGSSDHAAAYAKYLLETELSLPVVSMAPSMGAIYKRPMKLEDSLFIAISQSGQSPDLVASARWAKTNGAFILALVNDTDSPLAGSADMVLPLHAGPETSVAATKSYIASLAAILQLATHLSGSTPLERACQALSEQLTRALEMDWSPAVVPLAAAEDLLVLGRGLGFGIAREAALKFKETSVLHAEAFSTAEVMHGPLALIHDRYPVLAFAQPDETRAGIADLAELLESKGARVFAAGLDDDGLPTVPGMHAATAPIAQIQSFYSMVNAIALARGYNPDSPANLKKVTETL